ncbi:MAG: glycosyltransferase family 39 protein [Chloroflexota bacterium]|nr:glycosyltransferase family 39 protein [Chloroflexota bacterium]
MAVPSPRSSPRPEGQDRERRAWLLQAAGLFILALVPRLLNLGAFITWDELMWVYRSVHFSQALLSGDWAATFRTGHPGVVTTWLGALGIGAQRLLLGLPSSAEWAWLLQLPALDPHDAVALQRLVPLLIAAKIPLTLVAALAVVGCWTLARRLLGPRAALLGGVLMALDPFLMGLSRVLHLDGLLASFMALGLLSLMTYLHSPSERRWLLLSAFATGLAALTKTPALFLLPLGALLLLAFGEKRLHNLLLWGGLIIFTYVALWPAMWVAPLDTLSSVGGKALGYATQAEATAHFFRGTTVADPGPLFYPLVFLFRISPLTLLGLLASFLVWRLGSRRKRRVWSVLLAYAGFYTIVMAMGAKKFDRYLLPVFPAVDILAALGWIQLERMSIRSRWALARGAALVLLQALLVFPCHPHYLAWYNPLLGGLRRAVRTLPVGWGEGLERAAAYLNTLPDAENLTVASAGVPGMAPKFEGRTLPLTPSSLIEADYVVIYVSDRQGGPSPVDELIAGTPPEHVVQLQGVEYAWIYPNESYRAPLEVLESEAEVGDALLIAGPSLVAKHYDGPLKRYVLRGWESEAEIVSALCHLTEGKKRIWHVRSLVSPSPAAEIARWQLASRAYRLREDAFLSLYQLPKRVSFASPELQTGDGPFTFGGQLRLVRYGLAAPTIGWGQKLGVELTWQAVAPPEADYTLFLHLVDGSGHLWGQVDIPLRDEKGTADWSVGKERSIRYLLSPWAGVPPGEYELRGGLYHPDTHQRLPVHDGRGQLRGDVVTLGQVQVIPSPLQPTVEELAISHPLRHEIGSSILLLGCGLSPYVVQPGSSLHLDLFWQVEAPPHEDYRLLVDLGGKEKTFPLPNPFYPSSLWRAGEILRGQFDVLVPPDLTSGEYSARINLVRSDSSHLLAEAITLGRVRVEGRRHSFKVPAIPYPLDLWLGDRIKLLGYDLPKPRVKPGGTLRLILYWQAQGPTEISYTVFTHLLEPEGRVVAQKDSPPQGGEAPTTGWLSGEVIADEYQIPIPSELPPGPFQVEVGMYDQATGKRLPMYDAQGNRLPGDRALLISLEEK